MTLSCVGVEVERTWLLTTFISWIFPWLKIPPNPILLQLEILAEESMPLVGLAVPVKVFKPKENNGEAVVNVQVQQRQIHTVDYGFVCLLSPSVGCGMC